MRSYSRGYNLTSCFYFARVGEVTLIPSLRCVAAREQQFDAIARLSSELNGRLFRRHIALESRPIL